MNYEHKPVLLQKVIEYLKPKALGVYVDGTLGGGGYAEKILEACGPDGKLIGIDMDDAALQASRERLAKFGARAEIRKANFSEVAKIEADGIVLDLGVSSFQFDEGSRGFSFSKTAPLDMRMDRSSKLTAGYVVNNFSELELEKIFKEYGEERFSRGIAREIVERRCEKRIETTVELSNIIRCAYSAKARHGRTDPATKVFQALRIFVNGELENLKKFLGTAPKLLKQGGRLVIISYHSLEDRIVKVAFKELSACAEFKILTKKVVTADRSEVLQNRRARSAKLRAIERI